MISVGICTRNRAAVLGETLQSFTRLAPCPDWELIVCGNACTDETPAVAERYAARLPLRFVEESSLGLSHARNRVLDEARGDIIAFVDDDVTLSSGWLAALESGAQAHPMAGVFGGPITPVFPADTAPELLAVLPSIRGGFAGLHYGDESRTLVFPEFPFGANMAFRKRAVTGAVRFDPALGYRGKSLTPGEERDFIFRLVTQGWSIHWLPGMSLEHRISRDRLVLPYLTRMARDYSTLAAQDAPSPGGTSIAGLPRWLVRRYLELCLNSWGARLAGAKSRHIARRIEAAKVLGQLRGLWQQRRRGGQALSTGL